MVLEFDPAKNRENTRKHGIELSRFADMDFASIIYAEDQRFDYGEVRWLYYGLIDGTLFVACVTLRGDDTYRVISLRRASRRERKLYVETV